MITFGFGLGSLQMLIYFCHSDFNNQLSLELILIQWIF